MSENIYTVLDENGVPSASVDLEQIRAAGAALSYGLAAESARPDVVQWLLDGALLEHGPRGAGYVYAAALQHMIVGVVEPLLEITDELHRTGRLGVNVRDGLTKAAGGEL